MMLTLDGIVIPVWAIQEVGAIQPHTTWEDIPVKWWQFPRQDYVKDGKFVFVVVTTFRGHEVVSNTKEKALERRQEIIDCISRATP